MMVRQHHQLNRHEFEQTPGGSGGQRSLACCSPWVAKSWAQLGDRTTTRTSLQTLLIPAACPTNGPRGKRKKKLWLKIQFRMKHFIQLSGHFSFLQSGKFYIYSLSFLTWTLRKKLKRPHQPHRDSLGHLHFLSTRYKSGGFCALFWVWYFTRMTHRTLFLQYP